MTGWECPRCHRTYSPFVRVCEVCAIQPTFTSTSTGEFALDRLLPSMQDKVDAAVKAERERCANIAGFSYSRQDIAAAIREGGKSE